MTFMFTPSESNLQKIKVPYLEEARANFAPYYDQRDANDLKVKNQIYTEMAKLGAGNVFFQEGYFGENPKRYGYVMHFTLGTNPAEIVIAGLPMKSETAAKKMKVRLQALCIVRDWLKSAVTAQVFSPGNHPLIQFLLVDGQRTVAQAILEDKRMPDMNPMLTSGETK